jgi:hypothetical protein
MRHAGCEPLARRELFMMFSQVTVQRSAFGALGAFRYKVSVTLPAPVVASLGQFGQIAVSLSSRYFDVAQEWTLHNNWLYRIGTQF